MVRIRGVLSGVYAGVVFFQEPLIAFVLKGVPKETSFVFCQELLLFCWLKDQMSHLLETPG